MGVPNLVLLVASLCTSVVLKHEQELHNVFSLNLPKPQIRALHRQKPSRSTKAAHKSIAMRGAREDKGKAGTAGSLTMTSASRIQTPP